MSYQTVLSKNCNGASVLCFGELLLRLSPPGDTSWLYNHNVHIYLAGAECNVAIALAKWGLPVRYCTALPPNSVVTNIKQYLNERGLDTSAITESGNRMGMLFIPQGTDLRRGGVIYDRKHSSFGELQPGMIDWDKVLDGVGWFHFTAINPALGLNTAAVCEEALAAARHKGITISVDLNHRASLWKYGSHPHEIMPSLVEYCDVVMGNIWSANTLLNIPVDEAAIASKTRDAYAAHAQQTSAAIQGVYKNCKAVACTFRLDDEANGGLDYFATLFCNNNLHISGNFRAQTVVDRVGSGDCFMAGLIYGLYNNHAPADVIEYAAAAAFGKLQERGDFTNHTTQQVHKIIQHHAYTI